MVAIGLVRRAVGLDGRVEVELYSGDIGRLSPGAGLDAGDRQLEVESASPGRKGLFTVRFKGVNDRTAADALRGAELRLPESALPAPPEGTYYHYQLIGCTVVDPSGNRTGILSGIMETGANDVYVVSLDSGGEVLAPATKDTVTQVDIVRGIITVDLPSGPAVGDVDE